MKNFLELTIKLNKNLNNLRKEKKTDLIAFGLVFDMKFKLLTQNLPLIYII
jgi:hypothetical protein